MRAIHNTSAVTVSTPLIADYLRRANSHVRVLPNYLDDRLWQLREPDRRPVEPAEVVLGYFGGRSHLPDLEMIEPVLQRLLKRYGDKVKLHFWGGSPPASLLAFEQVQYTRLDLGYADFAHFCRDWRCDIALAPLQDNLFNRCKSAIKHLEYSAMGAAGVFSDLEPYRQGIENGSNGFLAKTLDDWESALYLLVENEDLRRKIAAQAQTRLRQEGLLAGRQEQWLDVYQEIADLAADGKIGAAPNWLAEETRRLDDEAFLLKQAQVNSMQVDLAAKQAQLDRATRDLEIKLAEWAQERVRLVEDLRQLEETYGQERVGLKKEKDRLAAEIRRQARQFKVIVREDEQINARQETYLQQKDEEILEIQRDLHKNKDLLIIKDHQIDRQVAQLGEKQQAIDLLRTDLQHTRALLEDINTALLEVHASRAWKAVKKAWAVRVWILPRNSRRERWLQRMLRLGRKPAAMAVSAASARESGVSAPLGITANAAAVNSLPFCFDILVFPVIDWDFRFQRPQQLALQFAKAGHRIFYIRTTLKGDRGDIRALAPNIYEVQLPGSEALNLYTHVMDGPTRQRLQEALADLRLTLRIDEAVCLVDLPFWGDLALALRDRFGWRVVYDCMDYHRGFSTNNQAMLDNEQILTQNADLVAATSHLLYDEQVKHNRNTVLVPNAGDFYHFRLPLGGVPPELAGLPHPMIGYYGAISDWFDTALVAWLARQRPDWSFVLIGSTFGADLSPLQGLANVHLLGEKSYSTLPPYLHAFDVCMIPFQVTPLTQATNPVKLFEYLSAGKAVVATELDELRYYRERIYLASNREAWLQALDKAVIDNDLPAVTARMEFARQNTWAERAHQMKQAIVDIYPKMSIVIVTYNNLDYNRLCLSSIFEKNLYPNLEVIVVDNASQDQTPAFLAEISARHSQVKVIYNDTNTGFAHANNQGAEAATGDLIVFLNNDTLVTPALFSRLAFYLRHRGVGMVGPVTNFSGNESFIPVTYQNIDQMQPFADAYTAAHVGQTFSIKMLAFHCVALRKEVVREVGPLDEQFGLGMFEDDDYAERVTRLGYEILCAEDAFVHHWGRSTFNKLNSETYQRLFEENRRKFEQKWGVTWMPHQYR